MAPITYTKKPLVFNVARRATEVITPAKPTPYEFKELSDIDDQAGLRFLVSAVMFYRKQDVQHEGRDPAKVLKDAMSKVLVPYYPFAGRLREKPGNKLVVECNGEGILFTEANADVTLEEFGEPLHPPFPCFDELLYDVPGISALDSPLIVMQVTKLQCGGFVVAFRVNHAMTDAQGFAQFLKAMTELARGAQSPSIEPVWARHLLCARDPPRVTCQHREYEEIPAIEDSTTTSLDDMVHKSIYFGPNEIAAFKHHIPPHEKSTTFEIISACLWRCHAISLRLHPQETVKLNFVINAQSLYNPPLPLGYYGNVVTPSVATSTSANLSCNPLSNALRLMKKAKAEVTQEYMNSLADFVHLEEKPMYKVDHRNFLLSDISRVQGIEFDDFGWGQPAYLGPGESGIGWMHGGFYLSFKNEKGEKGVVISLCLPRKVMEIFVEELNKLLCDPPSSLSTLRISSSL